MGNVEYFDSVGILGDTTCLAHCIWLEESELDLIRKRNARVLHCPSSNLKLGSGVARIPEMLDRGISVSLGADGAPCNNCLDMFQEMKLAALIQKPLHGPRAMSADAVFAIATIGGARALGIDNYTGSIEPGKKADLVLLDLRRVWNPSGEGDPYSTIVYSASRENVHSVMIDGSWVLHDGEITTIDEPRIVENARNELRMLLDRLPGTRDSHPS
jgi:cytosine/adenosine deaminase-related metal-dependent hydrolase